MRKAASEVGRIASLGGGPIGAGWAAHFLARGYDVTGYIHDRSEESTYRGIIETGWRSLVELGLQPGASLDRLTITTDSLVCSRSNSDDESIQARPPGQPATLGG